MQKRLRPWHLLVLLLALAAGAVVSKARILEGDMEVAGGRADLPVRRAAPVDPSIKYTYSCRMELNDGLEYRGRRIRVDGRRVGYDLWAYADFTFTETNRGVVSDQLNFRWLAVVEDEKAEDGLREIPLERAPKDAFSTRGHSAYLFASQLEKDKPYRVHLSGTVKLPLGEFYHHQTGRTEGDANTERLTFQVDASLARERAPRDGEPAQLWRRLYVRCTKIQ